MDDFVKNQLTLTGCVQLIKDFTDNEIDESAFRSLTRKDLELMLPGKVGLQVKIWSRIAKLREPQRPVGNGLGAMPEYKKAKKIGALDGLSVSMGDLSRPPPPAIRISPGRGAQQVKQFNHPLPRRAISQPENGAPSLHSLVEANQYSNPYRDRETFGNRLYKSKASHALPITKLMGDVPPSPPMSNTLMIRETLAQALQLPRGTLSDNTEVAGDARYSNPVQMTSVNRCSSKPAPDVPKVGEYPGAPLSSSKAPNTGLTSAVVTYSKVNPTPPIATPPIATPPIATPPIATPPIATPPNASDVPTEDLLGIQFSSDVSPPTGQGRKNDSVLEGTKPLTEKVKETLGNVNILTSNSPEKPCHYEPKPVQEIRKQLSATTLSDESDRLTDKNKIETLLADTTNAIIPKSTCTESVASKLNIASLVGFKVAVNGSDARRNAIPPKLVKHRRGLPVYQTKERFLELVKHNQVVLVKGETGSGKSTQLTQYLFEAGYAVDGKIACTQPRRIAAKSLAKRVAEEIGTELGDQVGYRIRFENLAASNTLIIYMTDGVLVQELASEPNIYAYSVIILDEAHERSLHTDMLLGLLKKTIARRPDLKVIVTSATLDCDKFSKYFNKAPVFEIPGRIFPVEIIYSLNPNPDYMNASVRTVLDIHRHEGEGDILVFLGGQDEIERMYDLLSGTPSANNMWILPCYSALSMEEQNLVFEPTPPEYTRKVVIATNIAETSITIDGIVFVVDSGIMKQSEYDPKKRIRTLKSIRISQAQAIQRSGRAGRTKPGKAYRLYSEYQFKREMREAPVPEIQRCDLEQTILLLASHGIEDVSSFDFIDKPPPEAIRSALVELTYLQAIHDGKLTEIGRQIAKFPLEPKLAKILVTSSQLKCANEVLAIISMLSVQSSTGKVFCRPKRNQHRADMAKTSFFKPQGDHLTMLNAFQQWCSVHFSEPWCKEKFLNVRALKESLEIRKQLETIMEVNGFLQPRGSLSTDQQAVQKAFASGYFSQIARKTGKGHGYVTFANPDEQELVYLHPGSSLFKNAPNWVIYEELIHTGNKPYLVNVIAVEPRWIEEFAPVFYPILRRTFPQVDPAWRRNLSFHELQDRLNERLFSDIF